MPPLLCNPAVVPLNASSKLITLMVLGRRTEAIAILGNEVIQPRGLVGQATDVIDSSATELKQIFHVLADAQYPIFFHCVSSGSPHSLPLRSSSLGLRDAQVPINLLDPACMHAPDLDSLTGRCLADLALPSRLLARTGQDSSRSSSS